jgi:hypothetical protein
MHDNNFASDFIQKMKAEGITARVPPRMVSSPTKSLFTGYIVGE